MANGELTIQQVHDNLQQQLQVGSTATLSELNLPSVDLWQLVNDTLSVTQITVFARPGGSVTLGPVVGDSLTLAGQVELLGFQSGTTITVTVDAGVPNFSFSVLPPARSWTFGETFSELNTSSFNNLSKQISNAQFDWASDGKTKANALTFSSRVSLTGTYGVIQNIFTGTNQTIDWNGPIVFDDNGPNLNLQQSLGTSSTVISNIVAVKAPFFQALLTYQPTVEDPNVLLPLATVALGMQLDTTSQKVNEFKFYGVFSDGNPTMFITGKYDDPSEVLTLNDVVQALMQNSSPPTLPSVLEPFFTGVGLQYFSSGFTTQAPPSLTFCAFDVSTNTSQNVWDIYSSGGEAKVALQEMHLNYSAYESSVTYYETRIGGSLRIFDLIFSAELAYDSSGNIAAEAMLETIDGLPLRFTDLVRGLGVTLVADGLDNFFDLSFSELGGDLLYSSTGDVSYRVYAYADLALKFFGKELLGLHNTFIQFMARPVGNDTNYSVYANGTLYFLGANLPVAMTLSNDVKRFTVGPVSFTLGDIIKFLVKLIHPSWDYELPAPWDVLNQIGFQNASVEFDLNTQTISLETGIHVDFGFINITRLALEYHQSTPEDKKEGVIISLQGTFLGLEITTDDPDDDDALSWDLVNGKPPAVPGAGEQLFHLEYLGLGQHISFRNTQQLKTIGDVINALETNFLPSNNEGDPLAGMNDLVFNENSGWLIGSKFTVMETVSLSAIFNDPVLYGLRVELAGPSAGPLAGLQFEILYKRITDTIGLYHIDLVLPDAIRQLEFGEVSIQIPEFVLDIYTNGNFKLDVGFPYSGNFDRSVGVEVFPFVGFGGFYFGYLTGETSDRVPVVDNGSFKPVLEFGIGLSIGVGKTIEKGLLSAGATVTVEGILEGVLAWFNPDNKALEREMFYHIEGTVGIVGHVYGKVDFAIIKASVDLLAQALVSLEVESYEPIHIELQVDVAAKVKVKVLFVTVKLSFEVELDLEWTVGHPSPTPWHLTNPQASNPALSRLAAKNLTSRRHTPLGRAFGPAQRRSALRTQAAAFAPLMSFAVTDTAAPVGKEAVSFTDINLSFAPLFSQSNQDALANSGSMASYAERARSIPMLVSANTDADTDPIFQQIVNLMLQRVVNARLQDKPPAQQSKVSLYDLSVIHHQLAAGLHDSQFSYTALTNYFTAQNIRFVIAPGLGSHAADTVLYGTVFPMIPALTLTDEQTDSGGGNPVNYVSVNYATDSRFMVDDTYEIVVNEYFNTFSVQSQSTLEESTQPVPPEPNDEPQDASPESMAQFIFRDYFLMITRSIVETAIGYMESFPYTTGATAESLTAIATANSAVYDVYDENPTPLTIAIANQSSTEILVPGDTTLSGILYQVTVGDSLKSIADTFGITTTQLVSFVDPVTNVANAAEPNTLVVDQQIELGDITYTTTQDDEIVQSIAIFFAVTVEAIENDPGNSGLDFSKPFPVGTQVKVPGAKYTTVFGDTLTIIAQRYLTTADVIAQNNETDTHLLATLAVWSIPPFTHTITASDSLLSIAEQYSLSMMQLLAGGYATADIIKASTTVTIPYLPEMNVTDLYTDLNAGQFTDPIGVSVSRFLMYGLRLPQISPIDFSHMFGLFNLTGQQLDVPAAILAKPYAYDYSQTLTASPQQSWVAFDNGGTITGDATTYTFTDTDFDLINAYNASFTPNTISVRALPLMRYEPNRYALKQVVLWQSPTGLTPVTGSPSALPGEPNIWLFPDTLRNRLEASNLHQGDAETSTLAFTIAVARREKPNQPPVYMPVDNFTWGTVVNLEVKQVQTNDFSDETVANDYIMVGADPTNRDLLYELWLYMHNEGASDTANLYILAASDPASQADQGVISEILNPATTVLLKSNLSTTSTQPPALLAEDDDDSGADYYAALSAPADFVKLLWECSTVNTGGYYLNYRVAESDKGLPESIFDQSGAANIQLLVIFDSQRHVSSGGEGDGEENTQPPMLKMSNCGILTDHLDLSNANLVVEAATYIVQQGQTLAAAQSAMGFATMDDFVDVNDGIKVLFVVGYQFTVNSVPLTVQTGDSLQTLAQRANTTPLAVANALSGDANALIPGAVLQYALAQTQLQGTGPVGSVGFEVTRSNPDPDDRPVGELSTDQQLNLMFNLLGYDLQGNTFFQPKAMTLPNGSPAGNAAEGFPIGPVEPANVDATTANNTWAYQKIVPYYPFARAAYNHFPTVANLPAPADNPYAGIASGSSIAFDVKYQDVYGNRIEAAGGQPITIDVGYSDKLNSLATWPAASLSYWIKPAASQPESGPYKVLAEVDIRFRVSDYVAGGGQSSAQADKRQRADQEKLSRIYYQYMQPDLQPIVTTTLDAAESNDVVVADYYIAKSPLADALNSELLFLAQLQQTAQQTVSLVSGDDLSGLATTWLLVNPGSILEDNSLKVVSDVFDLTGSGNDAALLIPINLLDHAADTLTTLVDRAKTLPGVSPMLTVDQLATMNSAIPLNPLTSTQVPERQIPPTGQPDLGSSTILDVVAAYNCTVAQLAEDNATTANLLRAGTVVHYEGLSYTLTAADTFTSVATKMQSITVSSNDSIQGVADSRGMTVGAFAAANTSTPNLWLAGQQMSYEQQTVTIAADDTLYTLANKFADMGLIVTVETLAEANKESTDLFADNATAITGIFNVSVADVALANDALPDIFVADGTMTSTQYLPNAGDTITSVVAFVNTYSSGYTIADFATANDKVADVFPAGATLKAGEKYQPPAVAETLAEYASLNSVTLTQIATYNVSKPLVVGTTLLIPERSSAEALNFSAPAVPASGTLATMATLFGGSTTAADVVETNFTQWRTLVPGVTVTYSSASTVTIASDDFSSLWQRLQPNQEPDYAGLAASIDAANALRQGAVLQGPVAITSAAIQPMVLATTWGVDATALLTSNRSLGGFVNTGVSVSVTNTDGAVITETTRSNETLNTLFDAFKAAGLTLNADQFISALVMVDDLIAASARFALPPALDTVTTEINKMLPEKIYRLWLAVDLARVNFLVTTQTIADLKTIPDVNPADADKLSAMVTAAHTYIDGDTFDAALAQAFGAVSDLAYLIMLTRRFSSLPSTLIASAFQNVPLVRRVSSTIPAHTNTGSSETSLQTLQPFAEQFQQAFADAIKVGASAAGLDGEPNTDTAQSVRKLWYVDFSSTGFGYELQGLEPSFFAPKPIATSLQNKADVPMRHYISGDPTLEDAPPVDVKAVNLDVQAAQFLQTLDLVLSPAYAVPLYEINSAAYESLVGIKNSLAENIGSSVANVLQTPVNAADISEAQAAFTDRLRIQLADAYRFASIIQFPVTVTRGGAADSATAPRLVGQPTNQSYVVQNPAIPGQVPEMIDTMATRLNVSQTYLVAEIGDIPGILNAGGDGIAPATVVYTPGDGGPTQTHLLNTDDTLNSVATAFGLSSAQGLIDHVSIQEADRGLFAPGLPINVTAVIYFAAAPASFEQVSFFFDISVPVLGSAVQDVAGIFNPAVTSITYEGDTKPIPANATLTYMAEQFGISAPVLANYLRLEPELVASGVALNTIEILPNYDLSTSKAALAVNGSQLTFFLDIANQAQERKVFMNLDFVVNQMEFAISPYAGDPDYQNSSWINFVLPFDGSGVSGLANLGQTEIPIVLEAYPDAPVFGNQGGEASKVDVSNPTLTEMKEWNYYYEFSYREAAQDRIYTGVSLNDVTGALRGLSRMALAVENDPQDSLPTDLLEALAQFNANATELLIDLNQLPYYSPGDANPAAASAVAAFLEFANQINSHWNDKPALSTITDTSAAEDVNDYQVLITRDRQLTIYLDTLIFKAIGADVMLPGKVEILLDGAWVDMPEDPVKSSGVERVFQYPTSPARVNAEGTYGYRVYLQNLDVVRYQSAGSSVQVKRNEQLISTGPTNNALIYQTPVVHSPNMYTPLIVRELKYSIGAMPTTMVDALSAFFESLFDIGEVTWPAGTTRLIKVHAAYGFNLLGNDATDSTIGLQAPVILRTQYAFNVLTDYQTTSGTFVSNLAVVVTDWMEKNLDANPSGEIIYDVIVYEAKADQNPSPVLDLRTIAYGLSTS